MALGTLIGRGGFHTTVVTRQGAKCDCGSAARWAFVDDLGAHGELLGGSLAFCDSRRDGYLADQVPARSIVPIELREGFYVRSSVEPRHPSLLPGYARIPAGAEWVDWRGAVMQPQHIAGSFNDDGTFSPRRSRERLPVYFKSGIVEGVVTGVERVCHPLAGLQNEGWCL